MPTLRTAENWIGLRYVGSPPQHLPHRPALGELIHEFVEDADLAHGGVVDLFDPDAADDARDARAGGVHGGGLFKELPEGDALFQGGLQRFLRVAGEPAEHLVELGLCAALLFDLGLIGGVHLGDLHREDAVIGVGFHGGSLVGPRLVLQGPLPGFAVRRAKRPLDV